MFLIFKMLCYLYFFLLKCTLIFKNLKISEKNVSPFFNLSQVSFILTVRSPELKSFFAVNAFLKSKQRNQSQREKETVDDQKASDGTVKIRHCRPNT
jgi:hypothetical protein